MTKNVGTLRGWSGAMGLARIGFLMLCAVALPARASSLIFWDFENATSDDCAGQADGTACGPTQDTVCDHPDTCLSNKCVPNYEGAGTLCDGDSRGTEIDCDTPVCDGAGSCGFPAAGTPCGDTTDTDCDAADTCDGDGNCDDNVAADGALCEDSYLCTHDDACEAGECVGVDTECFDGQQCDETSGDCACADLCGDLDFDGDVDSDDRTLFNGSYNVNPGQPGFNICADYTGDGRVTRPDLRWWMGCYMDYIRVAVPK